MLLSRQVSHTSNSSHLFWNLKDPVKITYMHDVGHMLHLNVAQHLPPLSPMTLTQFMHP